MLPPTVLGYYLLVLLGRHSALGRAFEAVTGYREHSATLLAALDNQDGSNVDIYLAAVDLHLLIEPVMKGREGVPALYCTAYDAVGDAIVDYEERFRALSDAATAAQYQWERNPGQDTALAQAHETLRTTLNNEEADFLDVVEAAEALSLRANAKPAVAVTPQ